MGRRLADLDERDYAARIAIREQLCDRRTELGLTQKDLGELMGTNQANVRRLERTGVDQSFTISIMRWARALGLRLVLEPIGFPKPHPRNIRGTGAMMAALAATRITDDNAGDEWAVLAMRDTLASIRLTCNVTCAQLGAKFGTGEANVWQFETHGGSPQLVALQRHARGIARCTWRSEAYLDVRLEPAPEPPDPVV